MERLIGLTKLQRFFCCLAGYDRFVLAYCPTLFNAFSGIGYLVLLGLFALSASVFVYARDLFGFTPSTALFCAIVLGILMGFGFKLSAFLFHRSNSISLLIPLLMLSIPLAFLVAYGLSFGIFKSEILVYIFFNDSRSDSWSSRSLLLFDLCTDGDEGSSILSICICIALFVTLLLSAPFVLIYHYRNSIYYQTFQRYVQDFSTR
ncbi:hypothetical protein SAMN05421820_101877 [Pedobacter steynii]|uniref:Uncharacterized protein n=1 Tax=Pedobacter steynii TaxID=430522 RepID=A0A1G9LGI8_9SPHI|nr:hypothetical protein [Pedobacter steynii]NQX38838.1 hypothetical protein [Pedobacter steynii]SDL60893.1 hypothetical protein SAMN05421820_101877 [Pedobacter steynii]